MSSLHFRQIDSPILWSQGLLATTGAGTVNSAITSLTATAMPKSGGIFSGSVTLSGDAVTPLGATTLQQVQTLLNSGNSVASKINRSGDTMSGPLLLPANPNNNAQAINRGDVLTAIQANPVSTRVYDFSDSGFSVSLFNSESPPRTKVNLALRVQDLPVLTYPNGSVFGSSATGTITNALALLQSALGVSGTAFGTMASQNAAAVAITGGTISGVTISGTYSGTATNVTGVVAVAHGGTGATTGPLALIALGAAPSNNANFTGTTTGITKAMVGLLNAENTADITKSVLSAGRWTTGRSLVVSGAVVGTVFLDGSADATLVTAMPNVVTAGTYDSVTVNSKGLVTGGTLGSGGGSSGGATSLLMGAVNTSNPQLPFLPISISAGGTVQNTINIPLTKVIDANGTILGYFIRAS